MDDPHANEVDITDLMSSGWFGYYPRKDDAPAQLDKDWVTRHGRVIMRKSDLHITVTFWDHAKCNMAPPPFVNRTPVLKCALHNTANARDLEQLLENMEQPNVVKWTCTGEIGYDTPECVTRYDLNSCYLIAYLDIPRMHYEAYGIQMKGTESSDNHLPSPLRLDYIPKELVRVAVINNRFSPDSESGRAYISHIGRSIDFTQGRKRKFNQR
jgi:hypothetical protein